jgi:glucokinase
MFPLVNSNPYVLPPGRRWLAADIGGTKAHFAWCEVRDGAIRLLDDAVLPSKSFPSLAAAIRHFAGTQPLPDTACFAFPGPIVRGTARATNLDWTVNAAQLGRELGVADVYLVNDLEAAAYGLGLLDERDFDALWTPRQRTPGNAALLSPGTGLGEAGLFWDGAVFHPFATEGGHGDFAAATSFDWDLRAYLQQAYGEHVSWERVLSGPGIAQLYYFLRDKRHWKEPPALQSRIAAGDPTAAIVGAAAEHCPIAEETLRVFVRYLACEAANLALKFNATGGVFIDGIVSKLWNAGLQAIFLQQFFRVGRLRPLLESMPVWLVRTPRVALLGAAYYAARKKAEYSSLN